MDCKTTIHTLHNCTIRVRKENCVCITTVSSQKVLHNTDSTFTLTAGILGLFACCCCKSPAPCFPNSPTPLESKALHCHSYRPTAAEAAALWLLPLTWRCQEEDWSLFSSYLHAAAAAAAALLHQPAQELKVLLAHSIGAPP